MNAKELYEAGWRPEDAWEMAHALDLSLATAERLCAEMRSWCDMRWSFATLEGVNTVSSINDIRPAGDELLVTTEDYRMQVGSRIYIRELLMHLDEMGLTEPDAINRLAITTYYGPGNIVDRIVTAVADDELTDAREMLQALRPEFIGELMDVDGYTTRHYRSGDPVHRVRWAETYNRDGVLDDLQLVVG